MKNSHIKKKTLHPWLMAGTAIVLAGAAAIVPSYEARKKNEPQDPQQQAKEASRAAANDQSTTLNDQTELAVTVYNSNIALIRDVRQLQMPSGDFRQIGRAHD